MTDKESSEKKNTDEDFSLYTEKIVESPLKKYNKFIRFLKQIFMAFVLGGVACFSFTVLLPYMNQLFHANNNRTIINIPVDEYPDGFIDETGSNETTAKVTSIASSESIEFENSFELIHQKMIGAKKSLVTVTANYNGVNDFLNKDKNSSNTSGLIILDNGTELIILTNYSVIKDASNLHVLLNDLNEMSAYVLSSDSDTGLALICASISDNVSIDRSKVKSATLDNSYLVEQGDIVIAAGKLMGDNSSVNYGIAVNVQNGQSGIDSYYNLINTNITKMNDDFAYLFNLSGNIIGIYRSNEDSQNSSIVAYGISDLKPLIQKMWNDKKITYLGINGSNITSSMSVTYSLPVGIYISQVAENSPAFAAGLQKSDIITMINGESIINFNDLCQKLYSYHIGDTIIITAKRYGKDGYKPIEFNVTLSER